MGIENVESEPLSFKKYIALKYQKSSFLERYMKDHAWRYCVSNTRVYDFSPDISKQHEHSDYFTV